jgi:hypothetical protein
MTIKLEKESPLQDNEAVKLKPIRFNRAFRTKIEMIIDCYKKIGIRSKSIKVKILISEYKNIFLNKT